MKIYVAGQMRGVPYFNRPAFAAATSYLRSLGHEVCDPSERDLEKYGPEVFESPTGDLADIAHLDFSLRDALGWDVAWIAEHADAIYLLEGWGESKGARAERALADALGLAIYTWQTAVPTAERALHDKLEDIIDVDKVLLADVEPSIVERLKGEVRTVSATGGEKGMKSAQLGAIDPIALLELAEVAGYGTAKYARGNYLKGYDWSLCFDAAQRHLLTFWSGTDRDDESTLLHAAHAAWHCLALVSFIERKIGTDDRPAR